MELSRWPVAVAGLVCLAAVIALAVLWPHTQRLRRLRPLAHVDRLTGLPEYRQLLRRRFWTMLGLAVLLVVLTVEALLASARPVRPHDAAYPEDIMLCVGQPVTEPTTAGMLNYFASRISGFDLQRIGLTSTTLRVVPMTRDYQYAADSFLRYGKLAALQQQSAEFGSRSAEFSRPLDYVDYAPSVNDVLALCMAGFPPADQVRRRSMIYLGDGSIRAPDERRPALFTGDQVRDMAVSGDIQVNVLSPRPAEDLQSLAAVTGGRAELAEEQALTAALDTIRAHPPNLPDGAATVLRDHPNVPLIAALVVSALLCLTLAMARR